MHVSPYSMHSKSTTIQLQRNINEHYGDLFLRNPDWSRTDLNADEKLRWSKISFFLEKISALLKNGDNNKILRILDVGCGRGWMTNLASHYGVCEGVEMVSDVVEQARKLYTNLRFYTGTGQTVMNTPDFQPYDIILSSEVIEHVHRDKQSQFVNDFNRLLKSDGYIILTTPRGELFEKWLSVVKKTQPIEEWLTEEELSDLFKSQGFRPIGHDRIYRVDPLIYRLNPASEEFMPPNLVPIYQIWIFEQKNLSQELTSDDKIIDLKKKDKFNYIIQQEAILNFENAIRELYKEHFQKAEIEMEQYRKNVNYDLFPKLDNRTGSNPEVSVIIVAYKTNELLLECLSALIDNQTYINFEIIVVDNGGNKLVMETLVSMPILYLRCPINLILSEGRNVGVNYARSEIIAFLDDDAIPEKNYIHSIIEAFKIYNIYAFRGKVLPKKRAKEYKAPETYDLGDIPIPAPIVAEGNSAYLKKIYTAMNGMNPLLFSGEGLEFSYRLNMIYGENFTIYWPETIIYHDSGTDEKKREKNNRYKLMLNYLATKYPDVWSYNHGLVRFQKKKKDMQKIGNSLIRKNTPTCDPGDEETSKRLGGLEGKICCTFEGKKSQITWEYIEKLPFIKLYAGDIVNDEKYNDLIGLSLTQSDHSHINHDICDPLPLPDNSVDYYQAEDVFEHIEYDKLLPIINEIYRVLKPNATFRLSVPDYGCDVLINRSLKDASGNIVFDPGGGGTPQGPGHVWFPRIDTVQQLLEKSNFGKFGKIEYFHYYNIDGTFVVNKIDYSKGHIQRTPDFDNRVKNPYRPVSMVIDLIKDDKKSQIQRAVILNEKGEDLFNKGDTQSALTTFEKAIKIDPNFATAYNNLGVLYWQAGEAQKALEHFNKSFEIDPNDKDTIVNLGSVLTCLIKFEDARNLYSLYLQRNPKDEEVLSVLETLERKTKRNIGSVQAAYDKLWETKLNDRAWLKNDGKGRVEYCANFLKANNKIIDGIKILDVGCGRGTLAHYLDSNIDFHGIDISEKAISEARKLYKQADCVDLNRRKLPYADNFFDISIALDVIEHVFDPLFFLREIYRVIKPRGELILSTPNILNENLLMSFVRNRRFPKTSGDSTPYDGGHIHFFTYEDIFDLMKKVGFNSKPIGPLKDAFDYEFKESMAWVLGKKI